MSLYPGPSLLVTIDTLVLCAVLNLHSHIEVVNFKLWGYLHWCCFSDAGCKVDLENPCSTPIHLHAPHSRQYNPAPAACYATASPAHPGCCTSKITSGIILLLLDFVSLLWKNSQAETPPEGIWTISAVYLGTEILFACNKKHYLLLPPIKWFL